MQLGIDRLGPIGAIIVLVAVVIAGILGVYGFGSPSPLGTSSAFAPPAPTSSATHPAATATPSPARPHHATRATKPAPKLGPLLSSTQYASYAYQIYPHAPSSTAQSAMAGFQVSFKRSGSHVLMTVVTSGSSQPPTKQSFAASDKIYFVEANFGDDSATQEFNFGDDGVIATNAHGYILG